MRRIAYAAGIGGDVLTMVGLVLCIPFAVIAVGAPIALVMKLLLWLGGIR